MRGKIVWLGIIFWTLAIGTVLAAPAAVTSGEFDRGLKAYDAGQYATAYGIWWKIKGEDLAAMRNVALMLRKGQGVKKDPQKAEDLFEIAANAGLINAEVDLAEMLLNGEAGPPNAKRALGLLQGAASSQNLIAEYLLGQMYETGNGVPKDMNRAIELYTAAARGGLKDAKDRLASVGVTQPQSPSKPAPVVATAAPPPSVAEIPSKPTASAATTASGSPAGQSPSKAVPIVATAAPPPAIAEIPSKPKGSGATTASGSPAAQSPSKPLPMVASALPPPAALRQTTLPVREGEKLKAGAYALQLGSFKSVASAEAAWTATHQKELLASSPHQVKQVKLGKKGTWYRLLVVGFKDLLAATTLCDRLKAAGDLCLVVRSNA